jgi:hypothetical protein
MTTKIYRWALWIILGLSLVLIHYFNGGGVGVGFSSEYTKEKTLVSASTHPTLILWALIAVGTVWAFYRRRWELAEIGSAGLTRRFLSFIIDLYLLVFIEGSFVALVPLAFEANRTGHFAWSFAREYSVAADSYLVRSLAILMFLSFLAYIGLTMSKGIPSVGEFLTGIIVRPTGSDLQKFDWRLALKRMFWAGLGTAFWPYTALTRRDKKGRTWYDRLSHCDVAHVDFQ